MNRLFVRIMPAATIFFASCGGAGGTDDGIPDPGPDSAIADVAGDVAADATPDIGQRDGQSLDLAPSDTAVDIPMPDDADNDAATDDGPRDTLPGDIIPTDTAAADIPAEVCWETPINCAGTEPFDYICKMAEPDTCPGGLCVAGVCIGPVLNPDRWADCADGCCNPCEGDGACPADCGPAPVFTGVKEYNNDTTINIWVHGWSNTNPDEEQYGRERGCGGILEDMRWFGVEKPCSDGVRTEPDQIAKFEYFGNTPADWLTPGQIAEIEKYPLGGADTLHRYALITAMYIRRKLDQTGATHVNLACHSYGCLISRYMMENNLLGLAGENRFVRWFSSAGVIAGARLARLYDNSRVREVAELFGIGQGDFVVMNPDFVTDEAAVWDHKLREANSPYLNNMLIHHACGDDPRVAQALNIKLLDLNNPGNEPNDGIMFTLDTYFHDMAEENVFHAPDGTAIKPTHSYVYVDHMAVPDAESSVALAAATLFHGRKVVIKLKEIELFDDLEGSALTDPPPAEVVVEHQIRYSPYLPDTYGRNPLISESRLEYRTPEMFSAIQTIKTYPDQVIFAGPVFDDMTSLWLKAEVLEVDWYPRFNVEEPAGLIDTDDALITFQGQVELTDHEFTHQNGLARMVIEVDAIDLF